MTDSAKHLCGLRLISANRLNGQLHPQRWRRFFLYGMPIGQCIIPLDIEQEHFMIVGATGVGKSTLIRYMLREVARRNETAIVFDQESEYLQEFYNPKRGDYVLQPFDARMPFFDPWREFRPGPHREMDIEAFANSLFRGPENVRDRKEAFFLSTGRALTCALFETLKSVDEVRRTLRRPIGEIHNLLRDTDAHSAVAPGAHGQNAGVLSDVANVLRDLRHLPARHQTIRDWCGREWAAKPEGWLFLPSKPDSRASLKVLQGLWLDMLARYLLSDSERTQKIWIFVDELPLLEYQTQIVNIAAGGRKRNICLVLGFQALSQLRQIYGQNTTETLISQPRTKILFGGGSPETNEQVSMIIGRRKIRQIHKSHSWGRNGRTSSEAEHFITEPLVIASEVEKLPKFHAYIAMREYDRAAVVIRERHLEKLHPDFIPRTYDGGMNDGLGHENNTQAASRNDTLIKRDDSANRGDIQCEEGVGKYRSKPLPTKNIWSGIESRCRTPEQIASGEYERHTKWYWYGGRRRCLDCDRLYPGDGRLCPGCDSARSESAPVQLLFSSMEEMMADPDMGPRSSMIKTVDRKDPLGNYEPGNVQWIDKDDQNRINRTNMKSGKKSSKRSIQDDVFADNETEVEI